MSERQEGILDRLEQQGACSYLELAELFEVSTMTIRRDADDLANRGLVIKTLGGIQKAGASAFLYETAIASRVALQRREKRAIAIKANELVSAGQTIFVDGGTTCLELAKQLAQRKQLTLVTNSSLICQELGRGTENTIIGIGGQYDPSTACFVGPAAEESVAKLYFDLAFLSTKGFVPREGTFESAVASFRIKQIAVRTSREVVLLVDHSKFGQRALSKVLDTAQVHTVITDDKAPPSDLARLEREGRQVLVARAGRVLAGGTAHGA